VLRRGLPLFLSALLLLPVLVLLLLLLGALLLLPLLWLGLSLLCALLLFGLGFLFRLALLLALLLLLLLFTLLLLLCHAKRKIKEGTRIAIIHGRVRAGNKNRARVLGQEGGIGLPFIII